MNEKNCNYENQIDHDESYNCLSLFSSHLSTYSYYDFSIYNDRYDRNGFADMKSIVFLLEIDVLEQDLPKSWREDG